MRRTFLPLSALILALALTSGAVHGQTAMEAYRAMGVAPGAVLTSSVLAARVTPGDAKQVVCVTTYLTGKRGRSDAVNVRLDVFDRVDDELVSLFTRDYGRVNDGYVGEGELQVIDLDRDNVNEIIVSYASYGDPLIEQRVAEVIVLDDGGFRTAWVGPVEYDATKAVRDVPSERRDRFQREFDLVSTIRTRGVTLFVNKKMIAVAGERLEQPKIVQETFPLKPRRF